MVAASRSIFETLPWGYSAQCALSHPMHTVTTPQSSFEVTVRPLTSLNFDLCSNCYQLCNFSNTTLPGATWKASLSAVFFSSCEEQPRVSVHTPVEADLAQ